MCTSARGSIRRVSVGCSPPASDDSGLPVSRLAIIAYNISRYRRSIVKITSEQVGGEHHVLELWKVEAVEEAVVQIVHARIRRVINSRATDSDTDTAARIELVIQLMQTRQVTRMAQAVIRQRALPQQLANLATILRHLRLPDALALR